MTMRSRCRTKRFSWNGRGAAPGSRKTASDAACKRIWPQQLTVITEPDDSAINTAAFCPNGKEIVTASDDGSARVWSNALAGSTPALVQLAESRVTRQLTPSERKTYLAGI